MLTRKYATAKAGAYSCMAISNNSAHGSSCVLANISSTGFPNFSTAASEVSSILESRISGSSLGGDVQETGRVLTIGDGTFKSRFSPVTTR